MYKTKILFFGTRVWELTSRHLQIFLKYNANIIGFIEAPVENISTTVTKEDPYENISKVSSRLNIPIHCPENVKDHDFINILKNFNADVFIVCGFQFFLPRDILEIPPLGVINFHSSLLPRHAGMHPGFFTIWYGDRESGMAVHFMNEDLDTGDIIYQSKVPVFEGDTIASLYDRIWDSSEPLIKQLLEDLEKKSLPSKPQDMTKYFYNYEISEKDFELDFRQLAEVLYGRVKMMPGKFYIVTGEKKYFIKDCSIIKEHIKTRKFVLGRPYKSNGNVLFATPRNYLKIEEIVTGDGKKVNPLELIT